MKLVLRQISLFLLLAIVACGASNEQQVQDLEAAVSNSMREASAKKRDIWRHPLQTLEFFGVRADHKVVELWPGGGWYTDILAPLTAKKGHLVAAHFPRTSRSDYYKRVRANFEQMVQRKQYAHLKIRDLGRGRYDWAADESMDVVLTFRNLHNWLEQGYLKEVFEAAFLVLKPGGVFGVVEHRAPKGSTEHFMRTSGYVDEDYAIDLAQQVGFVLEDKSEVNANPDDTKDHPAGVWTLPPSLRLKEKDRELYLAIGESDRMTLKFRKPNKE